MNELNNETNTFQKFDIEDSANIYLWTMHNKKVPMFRVSAYLKKEVVPETLQKALDSTMKRFPTFDVKVKKNFFNYYLVGNNSNFKIQKDDNIPFRPLNFYKDEAQFFKVLYYENRISAEFFHLVTDATGAFEFLKVLVSEYLRLIGTNFICDENLMDINESPKDEEFENAFNKAPFSKEKGKLGDKSAIQMDGELIENYGSYTINLKMNTDELKAASKKYNSTVTEYLLALMFIAGKKSSSYTGEINIQVPINLRKYYKSATVRNFSSYCGIRLSTNEIDDIESIINKIKQQLNVKASEKAMNAFVANVKDILKKTKYIPLFIKRPIANIGCKINGDRIFTNTISNMGIIKLPKEISENIESMEFVLGIAEKNRAACSVVTINNITTLSINKRTKISTFEETMKELLIKDGIEL